MAVNTGIVTDRCKLVLFCLVNAGIVTGVSCCFAVFCACQHRHSDRCKLLFSVHVNAGIVTGVRWYLSTQVL